MNRFKQACSFKMDNTAGAQKFTVGYGEITDFVLYIEPLSFTTEIHRYYVGTLYIAFLRFL